MCRRPSGNWELLFPPRAGVTLGAAAAAADAGMPKTKKERGGGAGDAWKERLRRREVQESGTEADPVSCLVAWAGVTVQQSGGETLEQSLPCPGRESSRQTRRRSGERRGREATFASRASKGSCVQCKPRKLLCELIAGQQHFRAERERTLAYIIIVLLGKRWFGSLLVGQGGTRRLGLAASLEEACLAKRGAGLAGGGFAGVGWGFMERRRREELLEGNLAER